MAIKPCPFSNEECKYFSREPRPPLHRTQEHGCFSDLDHKVPQRIARELGTRSLAALYIDSPDNKQQLCRSLHDEKTYAGDDPLPKREDMIDSLLDQFARGAMHLSVKLRHKLKRGELA